MVYLDNHVSVTTKENVTPKKSHPISSAPHWTPTGHTPSPSNLNFSPVCLPEGPFLKNSTTRTAYFFLHTYKLRGNEAILHTRLKNSVSVRAFPFQQRTPWRPQRGGSLPLAPALCSPWRNQHLFDGCAVLRHQALVQALNLLQFLTHGLHVHRIQ